MALGVVLCLALPLCSSAALPVDPPGSKNDHKQALVPADLHPTANSTAPVNPTDKGKEQHKLPDLNVNATKLLGNTTDNQNKSADAAKNASVEVGKSNTSSGDGPDNRVPWFNDWVKDDEGASPSKDAPPHPPPHNPEINQVATLNYPEPPAPAASLPAHLQGFIYVYDLPSKCNTDLLSHRENWEIMYDIERVLHEMLLHSAAATNDPEKAQLYFVPIYVTSKFHAPLRGGKPKNWELNEHVNNTKAFVNSCLTTVKEKPYWNRSGGKDHVFIFMHDFGRCFLAPPELETSIALQVNGDSMSGDKAVGLAALNGGMKPAYPTMKDIGVELGLISTTVGDEQFCFLHERDIVIPPLVMAEEADGGEFVPPDQRTVLAHFRGTIPVNNPMYSFGVRQQLQALFQDDFDIHIFNEKVTNHLEELRNATFCLSPPGHAQWSLRMYEAVLMGCIPVTFNEHNTLPWEGRVNYGSFIVNVDRAEIPDLKHKLLEISPATVREMQQAIKANWRHFHWLKSDVREEGPFRLLLDSLHARLGSL